MISGGFGADRGPARCGSDSGFGGVYDVVIVGGGPAGSTLARHLGDRTELRVLLIDGRMRRNCCGGMLSAEGQAAVAEQGLILPDSIRTEPQPYCVATYDYDNGLYRHYPRPYLNIDREEFDRWLLGLVPERGGLDIWRDAAYKSHREEPTVGSSGGRIEIKIYRRSSGESVCVRAALLVGADGSSSSVRRCLGASHPVNETPSYVAIQEWFRAERQPTREFGAIFDRQITDYYGWTVPKNDRLIVGAAMEPRGRSDYRARFDRLLDRLRAEGYDLSDSVYREGALIRRPMRASHIEHGRGSVALIGEAGGWISPSSSEGISFAIRTGAALAESVIGAARTAGAGEPGAWVQAVEADYRRRTAALERHLLLKTLKSPLMYTPWTRGLIMRTRVLSRRGTESSQD